MIVTIVPPTGKPMFGLMPWTDGGVVALEKYKNRSADDVAEVPPGVVTVTFTAPALVTAGLTTTIWLAVLLIRLVTAAVPKFTAVAPARFVPVIVTNVPPVTGPTVGLRPVTTGAATYVNLSAGDVADFPVGVVTVTSTVPVPEGLGAVMVVALTTITPVAWFEPKLTAVAPVNPVPVIVTSVPPNKGPADGLTPVIVGAPE
jgi:hypothetical protein